jgi:hypothetical protein
MTAILLWLLIGGFLILLTELLLTHHTDGIQLVAVVTTVLGALLCVAGLLVNGRMRLSLAVIFLLLSVTGLFGAFEHLEGDEGREAHFVGTALAAPIQEGDEANDAAKPSVGNTQFTRRAGSTPPPLAPLSLSGLSLLGAVAVMGKGSEQE